MRRPLLTTTLLSALLLLFFFSSFETSEALSVFRASTPNVYLAPPFPSAKLLLIDANLTLDTGNGYFLLSTSEIFSQQGGPTVQLALNMTGNVTFAQPDLMLFGFPSTSASYCSQSPAFPPLCPGQQQYINGPFNFGAYPLSGATTALILEEQPYINPSTNTAMNFLFASQALTWKCISGTCVDLHTLLPPAPLPQNASFTNGSFTVRRRNYNYDDNESVLEDDNNN
jgi:hypothetical protein